MKKILEREKIEYLNKKLSRKKYISILLALFTLGVNIFAWFAFSANAGLQLDGTVASWDVDFKDSNGVSTRDVVIEVTKMKPGMEEFSETVIVENKSDVTANFTYELTSFSLLGREIDLSGIADPFTYIRTYYPFSIGTLASKDVLNGADELNFDVTVNWAYESATPKYYALNEIYDFNDTLIYYKKVDDEYIEFSATSDNYISQRNSLYLEKDDADTYFGMACNTYEKSTNKPCLHLTMRLLVEQAND